MGFRSVGKGLASAVGISTPFPLSLHLFNPGILLPSSPSWRGGRGKLGFRLRFIPLLMEFRLPSPYRNNDPFRATPSPFPLFLFLFEHPHPQSPRRNFLTSSLPTHEKKVFLGREARGMGDMESRDYGVLLWGDCGKGCVPGDGDFVTDV